MRSSARERRNHMRKIDPPGKKTLKLQKTGLSITSSYRDMSDKTFTLAWNFIAPRVPFAKGK